ncbi:hypothetical protein Tco_0211181 [Tanacetum coccineum]
MSVILAYQLGSLDLTKSLVECCMIVLNQIVEDLLVIVKKSLVLEMTVDESLEMIKDESVEMIVDEILKLDD